MSVACRHPKITVLIALAVSGLMLPFAFGQDAKGVRRITVPHREHGYGNFKSQVINTKEQFDEFVKTVEEQEGWNKRGDFLEGLKKAKIDFAAESLVMIRQMESSGSVEVTFLPTEMKGNKLVCTIRRNAPIIRTADIADYCLAIAVPKKQVAQVEVWVNKERSQVFKVEAK